MDNLNLQRNKHQRPLSRQADKQPGIGRKALLALYTGVVLAAAPAVPMVVSPAHAQAQEVAADRLNVVSTGMTIDGVRTDLPAANDAGTTYIGLRSLNERLGLKTDWDETKRTVTVSGRDRTLVLEADTGVYTADGQTYYGSGAILQDGSVYVPLRFMLERIGYGISYDPATRIIGIDSIKENALTIQTVAISEQADHQTLDVRYPQLSGYADKNVQDSINAFLKQEAEASAKAAREELAEAAAAFKEAAAGDKQSDRPMPTVSFDSRYTVTYNEKGLLSLYVDAYSYLGGAHGGTIRTPYTFDLQTGKQLSLSEAAGGSANYVAVINEAVKANIRDTDLPLLVPFETIEPDRAFFLKHSGIVIYFEQYEYTPYAAGMPEFEVPFSAFAKKS
ncbi:DUF4163 domain-containing protein [Paenibacillus ginsengarvi]|uniref:DUF4163 domain-containing protein n=1 Tax=Paenibacillus ginsengarvi TaxID=400777 RepID=A0A3B0CL99_9BACL|nr:DUF4163 domain-containing protein [Paenibacillus ginsengarvi]